MPFSPLLVTNQGLEALAEVPTGGNLVITKVQAGSGYVVSGDIPGNFTALKAYVMDADSTSTNTAVLYQTTIRCNVTAVNAPKVFQLNEFGVWASLNNQAPFLYAYSSTGAPTGDTIDPSAPIVKEYVLPIVYATLQQVTTSIEMTDVVGLHGATHLPSGIDPLPIASHSIGGLCPKTPNDATQLLLGGATAAFGSLPKHAPTHISGGTDPIPVSTALATGLLPKLSNDPNTVLLGTGVWGAGFFPGFVTDYAGYTVPNGWLDCDGQPHDRIQYASLYSALGGSGSPWGQGDGVSTFNVPDLRGRDTVGAGQGAGLTNRVIGATGGEEGHTLTVAELAQHNHDVDEHGGHTHIVYDPGHFHTTYDPGHLTQLIDNGHAHGTADGGHTHPMYDPTHAHSAGFVAGRTNKSSSTDLVGPDHYYFGTNIYQTVTVNPAATGVATYSAATKIGIYANTTGITAALAYTQIQINPAPTKVAVQSATTGITVKNNGSSQPHNNLAPFAVLRKIIKT